MHWLFEKFEQAALFIVVMCYLAAGITAVAVWFGAGALPGYLDAGLATWQPWFLAIAVEVQTFLTVRGVSKRWADLQSPVLEKSVRQRLLHQIYVYCGILGGLLAFSFWNQLNYNLLHWSPPVNAVIPIPLWVEYVVKSLVIPLLVCIAAFIAPQPETLSGKMDREAMRTLNQFLKVLDSQRRRMLGRLKRQDIDMGKAIEAVAGAAGERRAGATIATIQGAITSLVGGSTVQQIAPTVPVGPLPESSIESKARKAWRPGMTVKQLAKAAGITESSAKRYRARFMSETSPTVRLIDRRRA